MNDIHKHFNESDFEAEEVFAEDTFDAAFREREAREGRMVDEYLDEESEQ